MAEYQEYDLDSLMGSEDEDDEPNEVKVMDILLQRNRIENEIKDWNFF